MSKPYTITAKLVITVETDTPEEAQQIAKTIVDEAMYDYMTTKGELLQVPIKIAKASVRVWKRVRKEDDEA